MFKSVNIAIFIFLSVICISAAFQQAPTFKNLQVLPKDIPEEKLDSIMHSYCEALKVECEFCHVKLDSSQVGDDGEDIDYVSDANPMKADARRMIRMTMEINQKYFYYDSTVAPIYLNAVNCNTCHRGDPFPL